MKSSFLPKSKQKKIVKISALTTQGRNPDNFSFVFWEKMIHSEIVWPLGQQWLFSYQLTALVRSEILHLPFDDGASAKLCPNSCSLALVLWTSAIVHYTSAVHGMDNIE